MGVVVHDIHSSDRDVESSDLIVVFDALLMIENSRETVIKVLFFFSSLHNTSILLTYTWAKYA